MLIVSVAKEMQTSAEPGKEADAVCLFIEGVTSAVQTLTTLNRCGKLKVYIQVHFFVSPCCNMRWDMVTAPARRFGVVEMPE